MVCQGLGGMMACVSVLLFPNCLWRACFAGKAVLIDGPSSVNSVSPQPANPHVFAQRFCKSTHPSVENASGGPRGSS